MSDDVTCMRHNSPTVATGEVHPEHGPLYRCMHDSDHIVSAQDSMGSQAGWTAPKPAVEANTCRVFRCPDAPTEMFATTTSGRRVEHGVCPLHRVALEAGEPYASWNRELLMGEDYRVHHDQ